MARNSVLIDNLGQIGMVADQLNCDLPPNAWTNVKNVRFRDGYAEKAAGHTAIYDPPSVEPYYLQPYSSNSARYWMYAGLAALYQVTGGVHTNITRGGGAYTGNADNLWTGGVMGNIAYLHNGVDTPQSWSGSGVASDLSNWPSGVTCKALRPHRNILMALNCTESGTAYPTMVRWSQPAAPGAVPTSWDYTDATKDCGRVELAERNDRLVDGATLGQLFMLYKENSIWQAQYVGGQNIFNFSKLSDFGGALTQNCIAQVPMGHVVFGPGDIYLNNFTPSPQSLLTGKLRKWLAANIDTTYYNRSFVISYPLRSEVWFCFPLNGATSANCALIWNWELNTLGLRDMPNAHHGAAAIVDANTVGLWINQNDVWQFDSDAWSATNLDQVAPRLLVASADTKLYATDIGRSFNGVSPYALLERDGLTFDDPTRMKFVRQITPRFDGSGQVNISVGSHSDPNGSISWSSPVPFNIGTDFQADFVVAGRYIAVKFESSTPIGWRLKSYTVDYDTMGRY